jgi:hypothetical protein
VKNLTADDNEPNVMFRRLVLADLDECQHRIRVRDERRWKSPAQAPRGDGIQINATSACLPN